MAVRKMTFSIPENLAHSFVRRVPARERSKYVAAALAASLRRGESDLIRACRLANAEEDVSALEQELDQMQDPIDEPWNDTSSR
jgi:hypothetical protein